MTSRRQEGLVATDEVASESRRSCGVVMPIASMGDEYPDEHWRRVRKVIQRAVERAGLTPVLVWENAEIDVIQSAILKNIYENDVIVCDVSNLNPNVMLETGLRLSTKRPIVIVTDRVSKPPFDISTIGYIEYQKDLEYNATEDFIEKLSKKIKSVSDAFENGKYQPFIEQFKFETVTPGTVNVSAEEYIKDQLESLSSIVMSIANRQRRDEARMNEMWSSNRGRPRSDEFHIVKLVGVLDRDLAHSVEMKIDEIPGAVCNVREIDEDRFEFSVRINKNSAIGYQSTVSLVQEIIEAASAEYVPF